MFRHTLRATTHLKLARGDPRGVVAAEEPLAALPLLPPAPAPPPPSYSSMAFLDLAIRYSISVLAKLMSFLELAKHSMPS